MKKVFTHPFVLSLLIIISLILFNNQGWLDPVKNTFYFLVTPGQGFSYRVSFQINKFFDFIGSIDQLDQENIQLKEKNKNLLGQVAQLQEVAQENELLRQQIGLVKSESQNLFLADIIGHDLSNVRKYFLINKGSKNGIKQGSVVIASGNLLVGQVIEVSESFSKIRLIIDSNSRVNALIQGSSITGLVRADQGMNLIIDLLPQGEFIDSGQLVVTSGLAGLFPAGLLIGQIEKVISLDVQISQVAEIKPVVNFENLRKVFVIVE